MFPPDAYQLLDFGNGRRLEQFGPWRLDRPCPAVERMPVAEPGLWASADARFDRVDGQASGWICRGELPERWTIASGPIALELKRTEFGHLGVFPEHAANWDWIADQVRLHAGPEPLKVLSLFAYTGGATLAAAAAGAEVVHVDSAKNIVAWARRNAELAGQAGAATRWIVEDAMKFVRREVKRGNRYDALVLDPPSYGHGAHGEVWRLSKHLPWLLQQCSDLTAGRLRFLLLTCHTPDYEPPRLERILRASLAGLDGGHSSGGPLLLQTAAGRAMPSGVMVRWACHQAARP